MTVYIVTNGYYSDYSIDKIFLDKEKAQLYCDTHNKRYYEQLEDSYDYYRIEEFEPYDNNIVGIPKKIGTIYLMRIYADRILFDETVPLYDTFKNRCEFRNNLSWSHYKIACAAKSRDEAIKIAYEMIEEYKSETEV